MALYTFKKNSPDTLRWHWELMEGEAKDDYFEYLWFDGMFTGPDGDYYLRVGVDNSSPEGSMGVTTGGVPSFSYDLVLPNGKVYDEFRTYKPEEFEETGFGGKLADEAIFDGQYNEKGEVEWYSIKFDFGNVACDVVAKPQTKRGIQFVDSDSGYSYYHPYKKRAMGWWPLVPQADVTGTVTFDGTTVEIHGSAYLDKQVSNKADTFGGSGQAWWTWGHFWAGDYTGTFTDSAATKHYNYAHFSPLVLWRAGRLEFASYDFVNYIEQYSIDKHTGKFFPSVMSQRASDGSVQITTQIENGVVTEVNVTSLENIKYVRQIADLSMQITRYGHLEEAIQGKILIEYGAGAHYMPWDKIDAL